MSYGRMKEKERQLRAEVRELLAQSRGGRRRGSALHGAHRQGGQDARSCGGRRPRLKRIREAKRALEERARQQAEKAGKPSAEVQQAKPADKEQYNFTDPESRLMKGREEGWVQG